MSDTSRIKCLFCARADVVPVVAGDLEVELGLEAAKGLGSKAFIHPKDSKIIVK